MSTAKHGHEDEIAACDRVDSVLRRGYYSAGSRVPMMGSAGGAVCRGMKRGRFAGLHRIATLLISRDHGLYEEST
jgi:hypothetical protein